MPVAPIFAFVFAVLMPGSSAKPAVRTQDSCNAPAKDAIVHLDMPGSPFEPVITADGCWLFVTLAGGNGAEGGNIAVVHRDAGKPPLVRPVPMKGGPTGAVLTHYGKILVVAAGVIWPSLTRAASSAAKPIRCAAASATKLGSFT